MGLAEPSRLEQQVVLKLVDLSQARFGRVGAAALLRQQAQQVHGTFRRTVRLHQKRYLLFQRADGRLQLLDLSRCGAKKAPVYGNHGHRDGK
jgi:hypothetical protein